MIQEHIAQIVTTLKFFQPEIITTVLLLTLVFYPVMRLASHHINTLSTKIASCCKPVFGLLYHIIYIILLSAVAIIWTNVLLMILPMVL